MNEIKHKFADLPIVAIVGRPNVGKSMLVNRISSGSQAIVERTAGVTRDRNYIESDWRGRAFFLVDTGGIDFQAADEIVAGVTRQSKQAVMESDLVIHVVDGRQGVTGEDQEIASMLRKLETPVILAVNKIDGPAQEDLIFEFYELSEGEPFSISALQGLGIGDLLDQVVELLPSPGTIDEEIGGISVAIIGKPNVGKSQLLNKVLGTERVIVSDIPGTTRDAIHTSVHWDDRKYLFIDTAGLRRKARGAESLEYFSLVRTVRAMDIAEVAILMVDAVEGITDQDQRIGKMGAERNCSLVVVFNKWDLVEDGLEMSSFLKRELSEKMNFLNDPLTVTASALKGHHINQIFKAINSTHFEYTKHIQTSELNKFVSESIVHLPPAVKGKKLKIYYASQTEKPPPGFIFFVNNPSLADDTFRRYLQNKIKERFGFKGCPIKIYFRRKK